MHEDTVLFWFSPPSGLTLVPPRSSLGWSLNVCVRVRVCLCARARVNTDVTFVAEHLTNTLPFIQL